MTVDLSGPKQYAHTLGQMVGELSKKQIRKNNSPAYNQFSASYLSKGNFASVFTDVVEKLGHYTTNDDSHPYIAGGYQLEEFTEQVANTEPVSWDITDSDLRYYYALGIGDALTYTPTKEE